MAKVAPLLESSSSSWTALAASGAGVLAEHSQSSRTLNAPPFGWPSGDP